MLWIDRESFLVEGINDRNGEKQTHRICFLDECRVDSKHCNTNRWKKILYKALQQSSKITIVGNLLQNEPNWNIGDQRGKEQGMRDFKLRHTNAIMLAGQISMSGDNMRIFEFCCGGLEGWSRSAKYRHDNNEIDITSQEEWTLTPPVWTCVGNKSRPRKPLIKTPESAINPHSHDDERDVLLTQN